MIVVTKEERGKIFGVGKFSVTTKSLTTSNETNVFKAKAEIVSTSLPVRIGTLQAPSTNRQTNSDPDLLDISYLEEGNLISQFLTS